MTQRKPTSYVGPAILEAGYRPFFFLATLFAVVILPLWLLVYAGRMSPSGHFAALDWHAHELIFGYGAAALTGFLFTAIPNWTGRLPVRGKALGALAALWLAGRLASAGALGLDSLWILLLDSAFLFAVGAVIAREIIAGRNWRNLKVVVPVLLLASANLLSHLEAIERGAVQYGERLGLAILLFLIMLIGGRIIPSFTRNWLVKIGKAAPPPAGRLDQIALALGALALGAWSFAPDQGATTALLAAAALCHGVRLSRWKGARTLANPLLAVLHVAYAFLPLGMAFLALGERQVGLHFLGVGAVGGMTMAVMTRAALGHSGRPLESGRLLDLAFALLFLSALLRGLVSFVDGYSLPLLHLAGGLWIAAFALVFLRLAPILLRPRPRRIET